MIHFKSLSSLYRACHLPSPEHPLLGLFSFHSPTTVFSDHLSSFTGDFYLIGLKKIRAGKMFYGRTTYDHQNGTMSFIKPGQVVELKDVEWEESGFVIAFHKDFLLGHSLCAAIRNYGFFDYEVDEALHISEKEERLMWELYHKIEQEYSNNQDEFSQSIMATHIDAILKYANRYYKRQFRNRSNFTSHLLSQFNTILYQKLTNCESDLPTVNDMADQLHLSPRYLSDLLKYETGKTAIEHIHMGLIDEAKHLLLKSDTNISETAYKLGFEHPTYFSRLFKQKVGMSPKEFRKRHIVN
ncbi:MAG: helix-turn-helix transcriptional regulator [Bacteroidota bacterium]